MVALNKIGIPLNTPILGSREGARQCARLGRAAAIAAVLGLPTLLGGCGLFGGSDEKASIETRYFGSVAADEPQAVGAGLEVLRQGGSAADAAAAIGLTLPVTLPSRAGLMGGGVCVVRVPGTQNVQSVEFLPDAAGGSVAVPGLVRGLGSLQAQYGRLNWAQAAVQAEHAAIGRAPVSRGLAADAAQAGVVLNPDPALAEVYSGLRLRGPADFYTGELARKLVADGVPAQALANYAPVWAAAPGTESGDDTAYTAPGPGGAVTRAAWAALEDHRRSLQDAPARFAAARAAAAEAAARLFPGQPVADSPVASTGFTVVDRSGQAISCALTLGKPFGTGVKLPGLGLYASAPVRNNAPVLMSLAPLVVGSGGNGQARGAVVGSGGTLAGADAAVAGFGTLREHDDVATWLRAQRPNEGSGRAAADRINGVSCDRGLPAHPETCRVASDPRGDGYAAVADKLAR